MELKGRAKDGRGKGRKKKRDERKETEGENNPRNKFPVTTQLPACLKL